MRNDNFFIACNALLALEGGLVDHPKDPGGITNFGISLRHYRYYYPNATSEDIRNLTREKAVSFYWKFWWRSGKFQNIIRASIATSVFCLAVHTGTKQCTILVQRALRAARFNHIEEDGVFGPYTISALNEVIPEVFLAALRSETAGYYRLLVTRNSTLKVFLQGWLNRAYGTHLSPTSHKGE